MRGKKNIFNLHKLTGFLVAAGICFLHSSLFSQISPGPLSKAHAHLEGISHCTDCHDLGAQVSEKKCLQCHDVLKARISQNKGYHASKDIKGKSCISCHSEHHGVNFQMIRFDKKTFNHNLTGYELKGAHKTIDCAQCHKPDNIADVKIKKNKNTYLGLNPSCLSCHDDYHQKTLSKDCASCHGFDAFKPASAFNHQKTDFPLTGAHGKVDCTECHKKSTVNGKEFQQFSGVAFQNCNACHKDPHGGEFGKDCKACHQTESFHKLKTGSTFNHAVTGFELVGKHGALDCRKCHDQRKGTPGLYQEFVSLTDINCLTCHEDTHDKKLGNECRDCHNQNSFSIKLFPKGFPHASTGFILEGKHASVDCRKCHTGKFMTEPLPHETCNQCHQDYHQGEFTSSPYQDCAVCHSTATFKESLFDFEKHQQSAFPLKGAHLATPCLACHQKENRWKFRDIGTTCNDCHQNIHEGFLDEKYLPQHDCTKCHSEESWSSTVFEHSVTGFTLEGKHEKISCRSCHFEEKNDGTFRQNFANLDPACYRCHDHSHGNQFEENGITDCKKCHGFNTWDRHDFNHDNARFKLEGAHIKVSCDECHKPEIIDGKSIIIYKTGKLACADCHS